MQRRSRAPDLPVYQSPPAAAASDRRPPHPVTNGSAGGKLPAGNATSRSPLRHCSPASRKARHKVPIRLPWRLPDRLPQSTEGRRRRLLDPPRPGLLVPGVRVRTRAVGGCGPLGHIRVWIRLAVPTSLLALAWEVAPVAGHLRGAAGPADQSGPPPIRGWGSRVHFLPGLSPCSCAPDR